MEPISEFVMPALTQSSISISRALSPWSSPLLGATMEMDAQRLILQLPMTEPFFLDVTFPDAHYPRRGLEILKI